MTTKQRVLSVLNSPLQPAISQNQLLKVKQISGLCPPDRMPHHMISPAAKQMAGLALSGLAISDLLPDFQDALETEYNLERYDPYLENGLAIDSSSLYLAHGFTVQQYELTSLSELKSYECSFPIFQLCAKSSIMGIRTFCNIVFLNDMREIAQLSVSNCLDVSLDTLFHRASAITDTGLKVFDYESGVLTCDVQLAGIEKFNQQHAHKCRFGPHPQTVLTAASTVMLFDLRSKTNQVGYSPTEPITGFDCNPTKIFEHAVSTHNSLDVIDSRYSKRALISYQSTEPHCKFLDNGRIMEWGSEVLVYEYSTYPVQAKLPMMFPTVPMSRPSIGDLLADKTHQKRLVELKDAPVRLSGACVWGDYCFQLHRGQLFSQTGVAVAEELFSSDSGAVTLDLSGILECGYIEKSEQAVLKEPVMPKVEQDAFPASPIQSQSQSQFLRTEWEGFADVKDEYASLDGQTKSPTRVPVVKSSAMSASRVKGMKSSPPETAEHKIERPGMQRQHSVRADKPKRTAKRRKSGF